MPSEEPDDESEAASALSATVTADGTLELSVVVLADAVPTVTDPDVAGVVETTLSGHTRMPAAATVAVSLRLVGIMMNVNVVDTAVPK